ncbi:MAG: SDR family NAD(P)-dependent oxidoreductase [Bacteroidales bacterium]|nr:SDR family NAD(P)-dependent oxidoreductase [Bacteroidales bacterium]
MNTKYSDIAVIGMSGKFPGANNILKFWDNICQGKESICQLSDDELRSVGVPESDINNSTYVKSAAILEDIDKFDPAFFKIAPVEAELMDPQMRLLLQCAWDTLEDSGYATKDPQNIGVFAGSGGIVNSYYSNFVNKNNQFEKLAASPTHLGNDKDYLSTYISYKLNLTGPSMTIQTACSTSLVAVHQACLSLFNDECDMALAGGVTVRIPHVQGYEYKIGHIFSKSGHVRPFDENADGVVFGSGLGLILIKKLENAIKDRDHIYAIIKGSAVTNDGKEKLSYAASSAKGQIRCVHNALKKAQVDASTIGFIESHGTGTFVGDPEEVKALSAVFKNQTDKKNYCALGSVKSNVGHLEAASGITSLIKAILALHYGLIPPTLHYNKPNPRIKFEKTPFFVNNALIKWDDNEKPRRAGVNSLGVGGTNAFVVLEEYVTEKKSLTKLAAHPVIAIFSAKTQSGLRRLIEKFSDFIATSITLREDINISDLSYTLQVGREAMKYRVAFIVSSVAELKNSLILFLENKVDVSYNIIQPHKQNKNESIDLINTNEHPDEVIQNLIDSQKWEKLAELWINGLDVDWSRLYNEVKPQRISLPTYSFEKGRYWPEIGQLETANFTTPVLHPLLHNNTSDLNQQSYTTTFSGKEFFLSDHQIQGKKVLPEVAYLEMVRVAIEKAIPLQQESTSLELRNIVWGQPIVVTESKQVTIALFTNYSEGYSDQIGYEVYSKENGQEEVHCQGQAVFTRKTVFNKLNIDQLKGKMQRGKLDPSIAYATFTKMGFNYGLAHQGITAIYQGEEQLLVQLCLPTVVEASLNDYLLHPSLMDSALQASFCLIGDLTEIFNPLFLPCALESICILSRCTKNMFALVCYSQGSKPENNLIKLDIVFCDQDGNVCVQMQGFSFREFRMNQGKKIDTLLSAPVWESSAIKASTKDEHLEYVQYHIILCDLPNVNAKQIEKKVAHSRCLSLQVARQKSIAERYSEVALSCFEQIQIILRDKHQGKKFVQIVIANKQEEKLFAGLSGLLKTATLENPQLTGQIILIDTCVTIDELVKQLCDNQNKPKDTVIKYEQGIRSVLRWREVEASQDKHGIIFKDQGIYLITGGLGGLGILFCKEIIQQTSKAKIILTGRSKLTDGKKAILKGLSAHRDSVEYRQLNIEDLDQVKKFVAAIISEHKHLDGIIHCAGMISDSFILKKTAEEFNQVLTPKVVGTFNLDQATKNVELDFLVLFSSIVSAMGNLGQSDYATANGFMDQFAHYRNQLVVAGERQGQTLSINWPLWKEGGMSVDKATQEMLQQTIGIHSLDTATGIRAFYRSLELRCSQSLIIEGIPQKIMAHLDGGWLTDSSTNTDVKETYKYINKAEDLSQEKLQQHLKMMLSEVLHIKTSDFAIDQAYVDLGLNSILGVELVVAINKKYGTSISNVIVYDYPNVKELALFLETEIKKLHTSSEKIKYSESIPFASSNESFLSGYSCPKLPRMNGGGRSIQHGYSPLNGKQINDNEKIAIIGMSGKYAGADNLQQYWDNLVQGKNSIVEFPPSRWDINQYYDPDPNKEGKTYCKWFGMLNDVEHFDPLFFRISPQEAIYMEPEQRLFLQESYKAFEDAGYSNKALNNIKCGVYLGMESSEYSWHFFQNNAVSTNITGNHSAIAAARISYFLNLKGPALSINTACSSSLVAIHLACRALVNNEVNMALAGGVRLWLSPETHIGMCQARMLSQKGQCKTFDDSADGIVMGEGVGAIVLKRLCDAQADNDKIYGVILGSGINQDGKTNGITAPSVKSQIELEREIYSKYDIHPETISYIETHGTGTKLGDPIELEALSTVFAEKTDKKNYCAIASVKTNIGHTAAASGIASVQKVLLSIQHRTLVPSLNVTKENSNFNFKNSPFYINKEKKAWDASPNSLRRASVSSFGFSGTNAHLVIEEYQPTIETKKNTAVIEQKTNVIIPLSARTPEQLRQIVRDLLDFIHTARRNNQSIGQSQKDIDMIAMAYTLQVGREAMEERLGFIVSSIDQLVEKLQAFIDGNSYIENTYQGHIDVKDDTLSLFSADADLQETIDKWMAGKKLPNLLNFWVKGLDLDWSKLYDGSKSQRISLPTYPFAKERYWIDSTNTEGEHTPVNKKATTTFAMLHPLLHSNTSDLSRQSYSSIFNGDEFFLKDHQVQGKKVLPGVAYLEMIRAAVEKASPTKQESSILELHNVVWMQPIVVAKDKEVTITLFATETINHNEQIDCEIYSIETDSEGHFQERIHCQGQAVFIGTPAPAKLDIEQLRKKMGQSRYESSYLYSCFAKIGLQYGSAHQGIKYVYQGKNELLAELVLPNSVESTHRNFVVHPSLMDSALQSSICLIEDLNNLSSKPSMPFALDSMRIISACTKEMFAWVRYTSGSKPGDNIIKLDIDLSDKNGVICVQIRGFSSRILDGQLGASHRNIPLQTNNLELKAGFQSLVPVWNPLELEMHEKITLSGSTKILLVGGNQTQLSWVQKSYPNTVLLQLPSNPTIEDIQSKLKNFSFDQLLWMAPDVTKSDDDNADDLDQIIEKQEQGILIVFRLFKALLNLEYADKELQWTFITCKTQKVKKFDHIKSTHAGLFGLFGSMAKEYPQWNLRLLDVDSLSSVAIHECLSMPCDKDGNGIAYRQGEWFCQELACITTLPQTNTAYKQNGVYVVIGGAGGLGEVWSRFMIEQYQAKIVWIDKRESNATIEDKIKALSQLGDPPLFITADATKWDSLEQALGKILKTYPTINGVLHSAIILQDQSLRNMEESRFRVSLSAKVDISVNMNRVFGKLGLDFMLFFSSLSSFHKGAGQANYNAGCTFKDSFAYSLQQNHSYPIKIVNWGYWGSVGVVADDFYIKRMVQMGFGSIEPQEGLAALQSFIGTDINQMVILKTINTQALEDLKVTEAITYYPNVQKASR